MTRKTSQQVAPANGQSNGSGSVVVGTREELEARAEKIARDLLNVSRAKAFKMLKKGKLRGTLAEAALTPISDLLAD